MGLGNYANFQMDELPGIYNNISALHSGCSQEQPLFDFKTRERRKGMLQDRMMEMYAQGEAVPACRFPP